MSHLADEPKLLTIADQCFTDNMERGLELERIKRLIIKLRLLIVFNVGPIIVAVMLFRLTNSVVEKCIFIDSEGNSR